ncbi:serine hydrolase domain-containing protein [Nocardioides sp. GXZ039]|uniref:serine hydrolase domain-containing protein n=1 Tax=Nocardioides sp. GXZ039 TaxID=3136018 RepID=UPI0030F412C2
MSIWEKQFSVLVTCLSMALLVLAALGPATASAAESDPSPGSIDDYVRDQIERAGVPGAAYAVVGPDGIEHQGTLGEDGDGAAVTASTPFLWGSVSKPVTATLAVRLAGDGTLGLDARVGDLVPSYEMVTVRQLLDHTSGLPEGLELTDRYDDGRDIASVVDQVDDLDPLAAPGAEHSYSSLNYIVLAAMIERATGRPFADVLRERLLEPAGMSSVRADAGAAEEALPPGHRYVAGRAAPFDSRIDPATIPAGYLVGTLDDLAAFARIQLDGASGPLDDDDRALLHTSAVDTGDDAGYGLGWRTWQLPGTDEPMTWHGGAAPGYQSSILLLPERNLAVVVLQNAYGPFQESRLLDTAWGIAAIEIGAEPPSNGVDPTYPAALIALSLLVIVLAALAVWTLLRCIRPSRRPRTLRRRILGLVAWLVPLALLGAGLLLLPGFAGVTLGQLVLWAPDLAWLVQAGLALIALLAVLRAMVTLRSRGVAPSGASPTPLREPATVG